MKFLMTVSLICFLLPSIEAQLSATDIRQASGKGPYPIYLAGQLVSARPKNLFWDFQSAYQNKYREEGMDFKRMLHGTEINLGIVINDDNFLGVKKWRVGGISVEVGYRHLFRNIYNDDKSRELHMQTQSMSFRVGKRINVLYPITFQLQAGMTFYNFYTIRETYNDINGTTNLTERQGLGFFESRDQNRTFPGWDVRSRVMFFDPAGTAGGLGFYVEYSMQGTFGKRSLDSSYQKFLNQNGPGPQVWYYGAVTTGFVAPLALRILSLQ